MLPHISNSQAGVNKWDPVHSNIFEVYFTLPEALRAEFGQDEALITEHVTSIKGLENLDKGADVVTQKFMGTTRSYLAPKVDETSLADITVEFTLNLRNGVDNYIYKIFKNWSRLGYDIATGETRLKKDYTADWLKLSIGNRAGEVIREVVMKDVFIKGGVEGFGEWSYESNDPQTLTVHFVSDWWKDTLA